MLASGAFREARGVHVMDCDPTQPSRQGRSPSVAKRHHYAVAFGSLGDLRRRP